MDDFIEGNDLKRDIAVLKKWIRHFGQFKIFVIVNNSAKTFFLEMFQESIHNTLGLATSCRTDDGCASLDVLQFKVSFCSGKVYLIFGISIFRLLRFMQENIHSYVN